MSDEFILLLASDANTLFEEAISKREDVSPADKKRAVKEYGDVRFADEKNKKYPVDTKEHTQAAIRYFGMPKNYEKYSTEERASIRAKLRAAAKKFGVDYSEDSKSEASADTKDVTEYPKDVQEQQKMEEEKKEAEGMGEKPVKEVKETPEEEKKESPETEKKEKEAGVEATAEEQLKARIAELEAAMDSMKKNMDKKDEELAKEKKDKEEADVKCKTLEAKVAEVTERETGLEARLRDTILASKFSEAELPSWKEKVKEWKLDQIELLASAVSPATPRRTEVPTSFGASGEKAAQPAKKKISL